MCLSQWKVLFWLGANSSLKKWCVAQVLTSGAEFPEYPGRDASKAGNGLHSCHSQQCSVTNWARE